MKWFNILVMMLAALGLVGFTVPEASGDIYSWTDENGVRYFTNHAPPKQAKLLIKSPEIPYDEEADLQRRETDRLEMARQDLAEREAFLLEQQQAAERRVSAANARVDDALREADRILQDAQMAAEDSWDYRRSRDGYIYGYSPRYLYKGYKRYDGGLYRKKHQYKYKRHHYNKYGHHPKHHIKRSPYNRHYGKSSIRSHHSLRSGRYTSHQSRAAAFRGRHGRR